VVTAAQVSTDRTHDVPVLVVGAGPAGLTTAIILAR
jgi:ribulose 1,5-bisphosphate synthetase/thiazole synthase